MTEQPGSTSVGAPDVGLYLDEERAVAAVSHPIAPGPSLHLASLHSTVLNTHPDGTVSLGDATDDDSEAYTHFLDSLADGVGVTGSKGTVFPAEQLTSMALLCLLTEVASSIGLLPRDLAAAATYPARWTAEEVFALRSAMNAHGLAHVSLVAEAEALAAWNASVLPTLQKQDTAVAAARGAAVLAAQFPVDAVTERFALTRPATSDRRPLFAAAAFAAALTVGAALVALQLGTSSNTAVPTIDNAQVVPPTTSVRSGSGGPIDFPTVVVEPAAEIVPAAPLSTEVPAPTETSDIPRSEPVETEIDTRPAIEVPEDTEPVTPPVVVEPVEPDPELPVEEPAEIPESDSADDKPAPEQNQGARNDRPSDRAPNDRSTGETP
ncbi:hypothetical protein [Rhodococcus sp. 077-4]|uniref:hypothetical protein n=1 Tax=Rhodococcus sp. 077-4 TaxID=2789271 RepID=UPI0039F4850F